MQGVIFLPLALLASLQAFAALCLVALPVPLARPLLRLGKATTTPVGWTVVGTLSCVLLLLLTSSLLELKDLSSRYPKEAFGARELDAAHRRFAESSAYLSCVLTAGNLVLMFLLRKLAATLQERELLKTSQAALLKQVQGLSTEYQRLLAETGGGGAAGKAPTRAEAARLQGRVDELLREREGLQAERDAAVQAHVTARSNVEALKSQSKGLENEYDRLLGELERTQRDLVKAQGGSLPPDRRKDR